MVADCLDQLRALLAKLQSAAGAEEISCHCKELLKIGRRWPEEAVPDEAKAVEQLSKLLVKFDDVQQQGIMDAFAPLQEDVRKRMVETASALNAWLSEAPHPQRASPQRLVELLEAVEGEPQMRWYKQCVDLDVKAQFLLALASVARAASSFDTPLRRSMDGHPRASAALQRLVERFFTISQHGNVLDVWHDGRLDFYNATLWRAAKRAADRLKDDLQVRLVSALKRAAAAAAESHGKEKPKLELESHQWPAVRCPLARAFLDFVAQRGPELGDLGRPLLSECPPHSLLPSTLRKLLGRLDAFEVLDSDGSPFQGDDAPEKLGCEQVVLFRLRWEAVAALAFKAVGTKPKASSPVGPPTAPHGGSKPDARAASVGSPAGGASAAHSPVERQDGVDGDAEVGGAAAPQRRLEQCIDWSNTKLLQRLLWKGFEVEDAEWSDAWYNFTKRRRLSIDTSSPSREVVVEFLQRHLHLLKKEWAKEFVPGSADALWALGGDDVADTSGQAGVARARGKDPSVPATGPRHRSRGEEGSSSASESSSSKHDRKRRKRDKRKSGVMGYNDYFPRRKNDIHLPHVQMMNHMNMNMMGLSMMMGPQLMMGMQAPMMPHQMSIMPTAGGAKKGAQGRHDQVEGKGKKDGRADGRREKAEQASGGGGGGGGGSASAGTSKAMIDADDL